MFGVIENLEEGGYYPSTAPQSITGFLKAGLNLVLGIGFGLGFVSMAYSFYLYTMSRGDPKALQQAWNAFYYSVLAIAISFGVLAIRVISLQLIGVEDTNILDPKF